MLGPTIFGVTTEILDEYHGLLGKHPFFQAWFSTVSQYRRLDVFDPQHFRAYAFPTLSSIKPDYLSAGYFSGMNLLLSHTQKLHAKDEELINKWGVRFEQIEALLGKGSPLFGDNPINEIHLKKGGKIPLEAAARYCNNENNLVIYDKYINNKAIQLIADCCKRLDQAANITVITGNPQNHCLSISQIKTQLKAIQPNATVECEIANPDTQKDHHDRFIFLGQRLQMTFTRGLDIFGNANTKGEMINQSGTISIYSTLNAPITSFVLRTGAVIKVRKHQ